jgi:hypothetical protein
MAETGIETPDIGVTLEGEINGVLKKIKVKTGLSVGRLANIGLGFLAPRILKGEFVIVNGEVVPARKD